MNSNLIYSENVFDMKLLQTPHKNKFPQFRTPSYLQSFSRTLEEFPQIESNMQLSVSAIKSSDRTILKQMDVLEDYLEYFDKFKYEPTNQNRKSLIIRIRFYPGQIINICPFSHISSVIFAASEGISFTIDNNTQIIPCKGNLKLKKGKDLILSNTSNQNAKILIEFTNNKI
ncbi:hypothetical protein pb186bvf_017585 [Paramecium bursaria]